MAGSKPARSANEISNLLIPLAFQSSPIPSIPGGWHQSWHQRTGEPVDVHGRKRGARSTRIRDCGPLFATAGERLVKSQSPAA
jgi:hypothetical protein